MEWITLTELAIQPEMRSFTFASIYDNSCKGVHVFHFQT